MKNIVRVGFVVAYMVGMVPLYAGAQTSQTQGLSIMMPEPGVTSRVKSPARRIKSVSLESTRALVIECMYAITSKSLSNPDNFLTSWFDQITPCVGSAVAKFNKALTGVLEESDDEVVVVTPPPQIVVPPPTVPPVTVQPSIYPNNQPPSGQEQHYWNKSGRQSGLMSWIKSADRNSARVKALDEICDGVGSGMNVWEKVGAGDPTSDNFGMPNSGDCLAAKAGTLQQNMPPYTYDGDMSRGANTCSDPKINDVLSGTNQRGIHEGQNVCFGSDPNKYVLIPIGGAPVKDGSGNIKVFNCTNNLIPLCSMNTSGVTGNYSYMPSYNEINDGPTCKNKGYYWSETDKKCFASSAMAQTSSYPQPSCAVGQYPCNGVCVPNSSSCTSSSGGYTPPMSGTATGGSYSTCTPGQYWNGTACANNQTSPTPAPTANILDAVRAFRLWFSRP